MTTDHIVTMKYLMKKSVDDLVLLYHLPTELFYNEYKINDLRKEIIIIDNKEIEFIRLYIEMIDSELYKHVGWVVDETMYQCMICQNSLNDFFFIAASVVILYVTEVLVRRIIYRLRKRQIMVYKLYVKHVNLIM